MSTWTERAKKLTEAAEYCPHSGEAQPQLGKLVNIGEALDVAVVVFDVEGRVWVSDDERLLFEGATKAARGAVPLLWLDMRVHQGMRLVMRLIDPQTKTHYRLPYPGQISWSGKPDKTPAPNPAALAGQTVELIRGRGYRRLCERCWKAGRHEQAASFHASDAAAWKAAKVHTCKV